MRMLAVLALMGAPIDGARAKEDGECRLWLAPSFLSTSKLPVFGLYAGSQGFAADEVIPSYEIAVPVFDFLKSPGGAKSDSHRRVLDFLESSMWVADYAGSKFESNHSVSAFIPGVGSLTNYHSGLSNVDWLQGSLLLREPDDHVLTTMGKSHPGRGAISQFYNATMRATKLIPPGMELFAYYGDYEDANAPDLYQDTVTRWDYEKADKVIDRILVFMKSYGGKMKDGLKDDVLDFMLETVLEGAGGKHAKTIRSLIPAHAGKLQRVKDAGGTFAYRNKDIVKKMDWVKKHGLCVDNLRVGKSTVEDAGRGAFVTRDIAEGATISPVPMLPILNEEVLEFYSETTEVSKSANRTEYVLDDTKPSTGYHLLLNYCYGHPESNLMLLPLAPMVNYVNHASDKSKLNAFLRWSTHDDIYNDHDLHDRELAKWRTKHTRPITMELVALRDIKEGEEILINYGDDWEKAFREYKEKWVSDHGDSNAKWPMKALELRSSYKTKPYPVGIQPDQVPYPPGVVTACFIETVDDLIDGQPRKNADGYWLRHFVAPTTFESIMGQNLAVCDLIDRAEVVAADGVVSFVYSVLTRLKDNSNDSLMEVRDVPHSVITLVDRPYTSDIHTPGAFRRWINMEDQGFPQAWRNVRG